MMTRLLLISAMILGGLVPSAGQAASALQATAAAMAPGTWAVLPMPSGISTATILQTGASGSVFGDANSGGCYDIATQRVHFLGMDHQIVSGITQGPRHVVYDLAANAWTRLPDPPFSFQNMGGAADHAWDSTACDQRGRMLYRMAHNSLVLWRYNLATGGWTNLGTPPSGVKAYAGGHHGLIVHADYGQAGKLLVVGIESGSSGVIAAYDLADGTWARLPTSSLFSGYTDGATTIEYSDVHRLTLFSAGWTMKTIGRSSSGGPGPVVATATPPCATSLNRNGIVNADPATGNFVLLCGRDAASWHTYDPTTNTWMAQPTPSTVPNHILNHSSSGGTWPTWQTVGTPITDHGVILYIKCDGRFDPATSCAHRLYKSSAHSLTQLPTTDLPSLAVESFVTRLYNEVLGRAPDQAGLIQWASFLQANCNPAGLDAIARGFFDSGEFRTQRRTSLEGLVRKLYVVFLGREPEPSGQAAWASLVRQARLTIAMRGFVRSQEFQGLLSDRTDRGAVTVLVGRLYREILQRAPDAAGQVTWVDYITKTRDVEGGLLNFLGSAAFEARLLTARDYVGVLYRAVLGRAPDTTELDAWEMILRDQLMAIINNGFVPSLEFQGLMSTLCGGSRS